MLLLLIACALLTLVQAQNDTSEEFETTTPFVGTVANSTATIKTTIPNEALEDLDITTISSRHVGASTTANCDVSDLQVDVFTLTAFVHQYAESATISESEHQNLIYLPKKVYDTAIYLIGATKYSDQFYGVPCTGTYPDLVFTILGRELHIPQRYYVDQTVRDSSFCKVLLDYKSDDPSYEFPLRFRTNICRLLY